MTDSKKPAPATKKVFLKDNYVPTTEQKNFTPSSGVQGNYRPTSTNAPATPPPSPKKK